MIAGMNFQKVTLWALGAAAAALVVSGLTKSFSWLSALGYPYLDVNHQEYARHAVFIGPLLVATGGLLLMSLVFKNTLISKSKRWRQSPRWGIPAVLVAIFLVLGAIAHIPFRNYPFCMDEYNYLYQARILAKGKVALEVPQKLAPFKEEYVVLTQGKLFSKYPPGFPALLSIGVFLKSEGFVNPAIATATLVILFFFVRSFFGPAYGFLAMVLMASTPYFLAYSSSYFSQPMALFLTSLAFLLTRRYELTAKDVYLAAIGLTAGYAALTRPLDGFCLIVPVYLYLAAVLYRRKKLWKLTYPLLCFAVVFSILLLYNYHLTGRITIATYPIVKGEFIVVDPGAKGIMTNLYSIARTYYYNGITYIPRLLGNYFLVPTALFIPVSALVGLVFFRENWRWVLLANFLLLVLLYNFHPRMGWPQYGARYYYSGFFAVVVLATAAFRQVLSKLKDRNLQFSLLAVVLATHLAFSAVAIWEYAYRFKVVDMVWEDIDKTCPENAVVLLKMRGVSRHSSKLMREANFLSLYDFRRNPFMSTPRLISFVHPKLTTKKLNADFPGRPVCIYTYDVLLK